MPQSNQLLEGAVDALTGCVLLTQLQREWASARVFNLVLIPVTPVPRAP